MGELSTHFKGAITEQKVALEFVKLGYFVSKPIVQSSKYDLIVDIKNKLYKIQVKTCTNKYNSYIEFSTSTSHTNTKETLNISYLEEDVDFFATIYKDKCYLIPYNECGKRNQRLRILNTKIKNNNTKFLNDYLIENVLGRI